MKTLKEEMPFAFVGHANSLLFTCSFCFCRTKPVKKCKGCHVLFYCNASCQKNDWINHKKECGLLKRIYYATSDGLVPNNMLRLVSRILLKSETSRAQKAFNGRSWEDLDDHLPSMTDEAARFFEETIDGIVDFLKPRKTVSREDTKNALCKVLNNNFDIFDVDDNAENLIGIGIYLGLSAHKHNCIPNTQLMFNGAKALLRPYDEEAVYSTDLTISYTYASPSFLYRERSMIELLMPRKLLKNIFFRKNFFDCTCPICLDKSHIVNRMGSSCRVTCCENAAGIFDESGSYVCNKCDTPSEITVKEVKQSPQAAVNNQLEVKRAETKILQYVTQLETNSKLDFVEAKKLVHNSKQVLSLYNFRYLNLCDEILNLCQGGETFKTKDGKMFNRHLADEMLTGYRYYLPERSFLVTRAIIHRAGVKIALDYLDDFDVNYAIEAVENTYGEQHAVTVACKKCYEVIKKENQIKRDELFREAGKLNW